MEAKDIGRILGAAALAMLPPVTGLYVYGKMKDKRNSTGASAVVGGLTMTALGIGVALLNYYMFGLDETTAQIATLIGPKTGDGVSGMRGVPRPKYAFSSGSFLAGLPMRVVEPFTNNFHNVGLLDVRGSQQVRSMKRVGCCGR